MTSCCVHCKKSVVCLTQVCRWRRLVFGLIVILGLLLTALMYEHLLSATHLYSGRITDMDVNVKACLSCFGKDFCDKLADFKRAPETGKLFIGNGKGVHVGWLQNKAGRMVPSRAASSILVAKSLAYDTELEKASRDTCQEAKSLSLYKGSCSMELDNVLVGRLAMDVAKHFQKNIRQFYNVSNGGTPNIACCPSNSLHKVLVNAYAGQGRTELSPSEAAVLRTVLMVNAEAAILKVCCHYCCQNASLWLVQALLTCYGAGTCTV